MSATDPSFPWEETSPGHFRQPLDSWGRLWSTWHYNDIKFGREMCLIASYIKFSTVMGSAELKVRLKDAWTALRYYNPGIACTVGEFYREYKVPNDEDIKNWVSATFHTHLGKSAEEVALVQSTDFQPTLHFIPAKDDGNSGELVILNHHFFNDARGQYYFWDALFKLVAKPEHVTFGDESRYLPPARDDLFGLPSSPSIPAYLKAAANVGGSFVVDNVLTPFFKEKKANHLRTKRLVLSEDVTSRLVSACRLKGISITGAFKAAHILAHRGLQKRIEGHAPDQCMCLEMLDLRSAFRREFDPRSNFGLDYHVSLMAKFELGNGRAFLDIAKDMTNWLHNTRDEYTKDPEGIDAFGHVVRQALTGPDASPTPPLFSSIGILENFMQRSYGSDEITIEDVWLAIPVTDTTYNVTWVWTWREQLNLFMSFDEAYYDHQVMEKTLQTIADTVLKELNVN